MKKNVLILGLSVISLIACKEVENSTKRNAMVQSEKWEEKRTYAEISIKKGGEWKGGQYEGGEFENVNDLQVPEQHRDHSDYIRYEGPGWENLQVAYRLYLDRRNAIDVFGKKKRQLILPDVGQDGFDSYQEEEDWGMDILKAGNSLGIGGYGRYEGGFVEHFDRVENTYVEISNTEAFSEVRIEYSGWSTGDLKTNLASRLTIFPQDRFTKVQLSVSKPIEGLCAGIVKVEGIELIQQKSSDGKWGYIATYGKQTLVNEEDRLGMALLYKTEEVAQIKEGPYDHLVVFKETEGDLSYYFLAAWEQEPAGISSLEEFRKDLEKKLAVLQRAGKLE